MTTIEIIKQRHSVRRYEDKPIPNDLITKLTEEISECNRQSGLNIQLITDEPEAFSGRMAHYGKFSGVKNYIAFVGDKNIEDLDIKVGYYGERIVLKAQELGLNTCWVALTYSKNKCKAVVDKGEKLVIVISLGYGITQGKPHKSKPIDDLFFSRNTPVPDWFKQGVECAALAPTAINQQKFFFELKDENTVILTSKSGFYTKIDSGIAKYHFEIGAGKDNFVWG